MKKNLAKRIVSLVLTLALLMGNFPAVAFATEEAPTEMEVEETVAPTEVVTEETAAVTETPTEAATEPVAETIPAEDAALTANGDLIASGTCGDNLTWTLDEEGTLTISGTGPMDSMQRGEDICPPWADYKIRSVIIRDGVTTIGDYAFYWCGVSSIEIPESVTAIGDYAFHGCKNLTSVRIPGSVRTLGAYAFARCGGLTNIEISNGVTDIGEGAFYYCESLTHIAIPDSVTTIGVQAFFECANMTGVNIGAGVTDIGEGAFHGCSNLQNIWVNAENKTYFSDAYGVLFSKDMSVLLQMPCAKSGEYVVPDGVVSIGEDAFACCGLSNVVIPASVTDICSGAFAQSASLKTIQLPDSVVTIGSFAFYLCDSLESIAIPASVASIGNFAFECCYGLNTITFKGNAPAIGEDTFHDVTATANYPAGDPTWTAAMMQNYGGTLTWITYIPEDGGVDSVIAYGACGNELTWVLNSAGKLTITGTGAMTDYWVTASMATPWKKYENVITTVVVEDGVTAIGDCAFYECRSLKRAEIADSVAQIGSYAFGRCISLTSVAFPQGITVISQYMFLGCENLTSFVIPDSVTRIAQYAFSGCRNLTNITIPEGVTAIGREAFNRCGITSIEIPSGVTTLEEATFSGCSNLTSVKIPDSVTNFGFSVFRHCTSLTDIDLPDGLTLINRSLFSDCSSLESIEIPQGVTLIDAGAFRNCTSLSEITIPAGVRKIGAETFAKCTALKTIRFEGHGLYLGVNALQDVVATAYYPANSGTWNAELLQNYGGQITWMSYTPEGSEDGETQIVVSGPCGKNTSWTLDNAGTLTISGDGYIESGTSYPWHPYSAIVKRVVIDDNIDFLPHYIFMDMENITSVSLSKHLEKIGDSAFRSCTKLTEITFPKNMESIGISAFEDCTNLATLNFEPGSRLRMISHYAFRRTGVTELIAPANLSHIMDSAFSDCKSLRYVHLNEGFQGLGRGAFAYCTDLRYVYIPDSLTSTDYDIFRGCTALETIENYGTDIWFFHFSGLKELKTLVWAGNAKRIEPKYFENCTALTDVTIGENVTSIHENAFAGCTALTQLTLPDKLTMIRSQAFARSGLTSLKIPATVTEIGDQILEDSALEVLYFEGSAPGFGKNALSGITAVAFYHSDDPTWTEEKLQNYGGNITWLDASAHEHAYTTAVVDPTCTTKGYSVTTCYTCGERYISNETAILGHDISETVWEATCTENGELRKECSRCDFQEIKAISAFGHTEMVDAAVVPTCTETGLTEGSRCITCGEILVAQEVIPALGHGFALVEDSIACNACSETMTVRIKQDYILMDLQVMNQVQLALEVDPIHLADDVRWTIEGEENVISVDQDGTVTALNMGTAYVVATLTYEEFEITTRCRIDVTEELQIAGIQLSTNKLTSELYSINYAKLDILLQLLQNNQFAAMGMEDAEQDLGIAIESARFENETMAELFEIRVLDDRRVEIIPTDYAVNNPKSVAGKYTGKLIVTVQGEEFTSETLALTVKKTMPKLKVTVAAFNSFYSNQSQKIVISGATATRVYPNPAQKTALPNWLDLDEDGTLTLNEKAPLKSASAKAYILVDTEEWRIPAAVTLSIKNTYKARGLKLSASSVTFTTIAENSIGVKLNLLCTGKNETLADLKVTGITAPAGYIVEDFNVADGSFTLKTENGFKAGAINLGVQFSDTAVEQPLKLTVKTAKITLKASATKVTLNTERNDSAVIDITATPADYQITDPTITLTGTEMVNKKKVTVDKLNSGELDVSFENGKLRIATTAKTPDKASYNLTISAGGSKAVTITINTVSTVPSVTFKATGSMDLSFPNQTAIITPIFKNCGGEFETFEYTVVEYSSNYPVNKDVSYAFPVERDGQTFKVTCVDEDFDASHTYVVELKLFFKDGSTLENTVSLKTKRTAVKLKFSATKLTLNKLIGDKASIDVTCTTKGYDFTEPVIEVKDRQNTNASSQLDIAYSNGKLSIATNEETSYGADYKVFVKADAYAPASTITVTIPKVDKSAVTATVKAAGGIDVIRDGSAITLTPTYKNVTAQTEKVASLVFYKTANKMTTEANDLFSYTVNANGTITVTKAEGAMLDHSAKYTVKLVTAVNGNQVCETKPISISVKMGSTKLTLKAADTMLFAQDKHDRVVFRFESSDKALNEVTKIEIKDAKYKDMFEVYDYGNGEFAIGFKDSSVSDKLIGKKASMDVTLNLNVFIDGNETAKPNTTAKIKLTIVK